VPVQAVLGAFLLNEQAVGYRVSVPSVYPSGSLVSITGQATCGDGHVAGGVAASQFGTITTRLGGPPQTQAVSGIASAQAFGTIKTLQTRPVSAVNSAQAFGVPTPKATYTLSVGAVASAQSFGAVTIKTVVKPGVGSVPSAQAFGAPTIKATRTLALSGIVSAQSFGAITTRTGFTQAVGSVSTAQAFGQVKIVFAQAVPLAGIPSSQQFGTPTITGAVKTPTGGVPSAQQFGQVTIVFSQRVAVQGLRSAQNFGTEFFVGTKWLWDIHCIGTPDASICGEPTCGDGHVVGGYSFNPAIGPCLGSPSPKLLNEFLCGQAVAGGPGFAAELDCLVGIDMPICGEPICGDGHVCGGSNRLIEIDCITSGPILNQFLCGQKTIGQQHLDPMPPALVLDLELVGSR
jgi:hypothetical protein